MGSGTFPIAREARVAGLSQFVIVDITNPRSAPLELQATVPEYMIPSEFRYEERLPLTTSGKLNRRLLATAAEDTTGPEPAPASAPDG